jgi:hypothetical protein
MVFNTNSVKRCIDNNASIKISTRVEGSLLADVSAVS